MIAFLKKDFFIATSYKFSFILSWLGIFISVLTFYFIAKLFGKAASPHLEAYGGEYFPFVLIGIAFSGYLMAALRSFSANLRQEQMMGTLEAMLVTPTKISTTILAMSGWNFLFTSLRVLIYLLFGACFFKFSLANVNFLAAIIILILTIVSFGSIGIISASFIMVLKRGDPINWAISTFSSFLGGVYFPISILPKGLRSISYLLPITYSLRGLRLALLQGYSFKMLAPDIGILLAFAVCLLPISLLVFKYALRRAKIDGSLVHY